MARGVDVVTETVIRRPRDRVAAYAGDPGNAPEWYANIDSVEWRTAPPVAVGSRMDFVATFLGRRLAYTYEVVELVPGERLVMRTAQGPFPMETTYTWQPLDAATTRMTLRNRAGRRGSPSWWRRSWWPRCGGPTAPTSAACASCSSGAERSGALGGDQQAGADGQDGRQQRLVLADRAGDLPPGDGLRVAGGAVGDPAAVQQAVAGERAADPDQVEQRRPGARSTPAAGRRRRPCRRRRGTAGGAPPPGCRRSAGPGWGRPPPRRTPCGRPAAAPGRRPAR